MDTNYDILSPFSTLRFNINLNSIDHITPSSPEYQFTILVSTPFYESLSFSKQDLSPQDDFNFVLTLNPPLNLKGPLSFTVTVFLPNYTESITIPTNFLIQ